MLQIFVIPATKQTHYRRELHDMLRVEIDAFLNVTKAQGKRMMPSGVQTYKCHRPKVVSFDTAISKQDHGVALTEMTSPPWLKTDDPHAHNDQKEVHVRHYSTKLLIRRVDGRTLHAEDVEEKINHNQLGFRLDQTIYFKCRSTPRDVLEKVSTVVPLPTV